LSCANAQMLFELRVLTARKLLSDASAARRQYWERPLPVLGPGVAVVGAGRRWSGRYVANHCVQGSGALWCTVCVSCTRRSRQTSGCTRGTLWIRTHPRARYSALPAAWVPTGGHAPAIPTRPPGSRPPAPPLALTPQPSHTVGRTFDELLRFIERDMRKSHV